MIETQTLIGGLVENQPLIGELGKTIDRTPATLITKDITQNGTYNASEDNADGYSKVEVNVPGPSGSIDIIANGTYNVTSYASANVLVNGLEYETGTYTPTEDTQTPIISFSRTHTTTPVYVGIMDGTSERPPASNSYLGYWHYVDYEKLLGATITITTSGSTPTGYGEVYMYYLGGSSYQQRDFHFRHSSSDTTDTSYEYARYYVTPTGFKAGIVQSQKGKFKANTQYKWIAIWK